jgi:chromosome partitioning protein
MGIIAIFNQKGGSGKTTLSLHLACWLAKKKKKVCLVDADPQQSASTWINLMGNPLPVKGLTDANELIEQIPVLAESHRLCDR